MYMADDKLLVLYRALRSICFDPLEKPSAWEDLTDVLEILAVWKGIKPAHLNGHGFRSERLLADLESVARKHGLLTLRTPPHLPHQHREPRVARGFLEWQQQRERRAASAAGEVLWIYRDPLLQAAIGLLLDGRVDETEVLGYELLCGSTPFSDGDFIGDQPGTALAAGRCCRYLPEASLSFSCAAGPRASSLYSRTPGGRLVSNISSRRGR